MNFIRTIYDWVINLSKKPNGSRSLAIISFSEASFFPIPPDVLLIPLCLGNRNKSLKFALVCSVFSVFGAILGYHIGKLLWWDIPGVQYSSLANIFPYKLNFFFIFCKETNGVFPIVSSIDFRTEFFFLDNKVSFLFWKFLYFFFLCYFTDFINCYFVKKI